MFLSQETDINVLPTHRLKNLASVILSNVVIDPPTDWHLTQDLFVLIFYLWNTKNFCSADPHEDLFGSGTLSKGIKVNFIFSYAQFTNKYYLPINFEISEIISTFNTSKSKAEGP